jgi:hypothetical protein
MLDTRLLLYRRVKIRRIKKITPSHNLSSLEYQSEMTQNDKVLSQQVFIAGPFKKCKRNHPRNKAFKICKIGE